MKIGSADTLAKMNVPTNFRFSALFCFWVMNLCRIDFRTGMSKTCIYDSHITDINCVSMARFPAVAVIRSSLLVRGQNQTADYKMLMACWNYLLISQSVLRVWLQSARWFAEVNCPTVSTCLAAYRLAYDDDRRCR